MAICLLVKAASWALGSWGGRASMGPILAAIASAIFLVCREAQMPEQLMHPRPELLAMLSTIISR